MNRNELKEVLGADIDESKITAILDKFHAEQNDYKSQISNLTTQNDSLKSEKENLMDYKTKYEEVERAKLSDAEKNELERKEIAAMKTALIRQTNANEARAILTETGFSKEEVDALVDTIVKDNKEETIKAAQLLSNQFKSLKENTVKTTREELATVDVKPNMSNIPSGSQTMDWEKFSKMSQAEQAKFIEEHNEEFLKL
jgi:hypothetical protein